MWPGEKQGSWASAEGALGCWGGGGRSGSLSPSCYKQGPPVCRLFQWGTEMNSMGGHGAPSQASACTTPPQSWGGPAICALCLRRGIASPFLFYTPLHTHMHNYKKHSSQEPGRIKDFPQGGGDPIALIYLFSSPSLSIKKERKKERMNLYWGSHFFSFAAGSVRLCALLSLTQYEISTFLSSFFSSVSPITLAHNERLCFPGSCWLTCWNCSHSSLSLPRLFWGKKRPDTPLKDNVWIIQRSNNFSPESFSSNSELRFVHLNI